MKRFVLFVPLLLALLASTSIVNAGETTEAAADQPFIIVVMDPLAAPLSCPCVEGYAQRKYEALAVHLESKLAQPVKVVFNASLPKALQKETAGKADLVIGKESVVKADAEAANTSLRPFARLTDKQGSTKQHGLIVVAANNAAQGVADLAGYDIIFGPADSDEKHAAAIKLLTAHNVDIPGKLTIDNACSDGATKVVERGPQSQTAAVISSYAAPLLEGCGTIKKGDLRVIGKTSEVPFVTAFISADLPGATQSKVELALMSVVDVPKLCAALESLAGFLPIAEASADAAVGTSKKN